MFGAPPPVDIVAFSKKVKRLTLFTLQPEGWVRFELPLSCCNVPIFAFVAEKKVQRGRTD